MSAIEVNHAPVMSLWAPLVAERLGFDRDRALNLDKTVEGLVAQAKGRWLGIFKPGESKGVQARSRPKGAEFFELLGRSVPAILSPRAVGERGVGASPALCLRSTVGPGEHA